jgi:hypothetical protein
MAAFQVTLNGTLLVAAMLDGVDLLDVHLSGDRSGPDAGVLRVSGFRDARDADSQVVWLSHLALSQGDTVSFGFAPAPGHPIGRAARAVHVPLMETEDGWHCSAIWRARNPREAELVVETFAQDVVLRSHPQRALQLNERVAFHALAATRLPLAGKGYRARVAADA